MFEERTAGGSSPLSGFAGTCSQPNTAERRAFISNVFGPIELNAHDQSASTRFERLLFTPCLFCSHGCFDGPGGCFQLQRGCAGARRHGIPYAGMRAVPLNSRRGRRSCAGPCNGRQTPVSEPDQDSGNEWRARDAALRKRSFQGRSEGRRDIPVVVPDEGRPGLQAVDAGGDGPVEEPAGFSSRGLHSLIGG